MKRPLLAIMLLAASIVVANAFGLGLGNRLGHLGGAGAPGTAAPPPGSAGKMLRIDGASFILRLDGVSKICRLGGC